MTQSAVSHSIKSLEKQLGCKLFDRINKSVLPKFYSEYLFDRFSKILYDYDTTVVK